MHIVLSNFQYQIAIISSRLSLDILTGDEIDWLMNRGYYDDLMLNLIDSPICPTINYSKVFKEIWQNLNFPTLDNHQAKLINTFERLYAFGIRPYHTALLFDENIGNNYDYFYEYHSDLINPSIYDENYIHMDNLQAVLYGIESCIRSYEAGYIKKALLYSAIDEFFEICENWINIHKPTVISIINQFNKTPYDYHFQRQSPNQNRPRPTDRPQKTQKNGTNSH